MCTFTHSPTHQGYTVRVESWRYTAWIQFNGTTNRGKWGDVGSTAGWLVGEELYSHDDSTQVDDFDATENENLAAKPENAATRTQLLNALKARFDTPPSSFEIA